MNDKKRSRTRMLGWLAVLVVIGGGVVIVFLSLLGPAISNIFGEIVTELAYVDVGSGDPGAPPPQQAVHSPSNGLLPPLPDTSARDENEDDGSWMPTPFAVQVTTEALSEQTLSMTATPSAQMLTPAATQVAERPPLTEAEMFFEDYGVNPFLDTDDDHLSTFAMDVDTASYTLARSYLMDYQQLPPPEAIRSEEFINYFDVGYAGPDDGSAFAIHLDATSAPFGYEDHYLLRVGLQGRYVAPQDRDPAFLIFVIDVSGSMDMGNRLGLVKQALALLVGELREDDRIGIVVYSDNSRAVLDPTPASESERILDAINALRPEGSTNVAAGLRLGYQMAEAQRRDGQTTRVIVLSDGVANVGVTESDEILVLARNGVADGITLSTIGFGMDNYNDVLMEQLANDGDGSYYYVDEIGEARRIFVHNLTSTLQVIAYDAKIQVDFNPEVTDRYRLIGYENRAIADSDFRDDSVDAGEIGAGHSITALYEFALVNEGAQGVVATAQIRYEDAETREVIEFNREITIGDLLPDIADAPADLRLHVAVAEFSELLRESYWAQEGSYVDLLSFARPLTSQMANNQEVAEFVDMIRRAGQYVDVGG